MQQAREAKLKTYDLNHGSGSTHKTSRASSPTRVPGCKEHSYGEVTRVDPKQAHALAPH